MEPTDTTPVGKLAKFKQKFKDWSNRLQYSKKAPATPKPAAPKPASKPASKKFTMPKWSFKFGSGSKKTAQSANKTEVDFLPDADEIERTPIPAYARMTVHLFALTLVTGIVWASLSEIDQIVGARGRLITPLPNVFIQPLETSIVQKVYVKIGQVVKKGERIATLDPTFAGADEAQLRNRLTSLENQLQYLNAELDGQKVNHFGASNPDRELQSRLADERHASYAAQLRKLEESAGKLRASQDTNRRDEQTQAARVKVLRDMEAMQHELVDKKLAPRSRLLEAQERRLEAERNMEIARNRQIELRRELSAIEAEKRSFETGWRQKIMEDVLNITRERDSLFEQLQKADRRSKLVTLTSPVDAVVLETPLLSAGSVVQASEKIVTLVPTSGELEAEVQIDSTDIGYIKINDAVHVKVDAFPFQKHGVLEGTLRLISEDAFRPNNGAQNSYYIGRIKLKSLKLAKVPENTKLLPGATLNAEIVVGKRSVISYLLWPLSKAVQESMREP